MLMLQFTSGQGPDECAIAVRYALRLLEQEAADMQIDLTVLEIQESSVEGGFKSVLVSLDGPNALKLGLQWQGSILWQCKSPFRPNHARKNWFIAGNLYEPTEEIPDSAIHFQACRSSGAGGQHVNKTSSAIHARHEATGISVKVQSERSQHANKRLAKLLLAHKIALLQQSQQDNESQQRWMAHWQLERGGPIRTFIGPKFKEVR